METNCHKSVPFFFKKNQKQIMKYPFEGATD